MKITTQMTEMAYEVAKDVHRNDLSLKDAIDHLEVQVGMNRGSANDYVGGFRKMIEGEVYTRTFNTEATEYYLTRIYQDFGLPALRNAVIAAKGHVEYYEGLGRGNLKAIRDVISRHELLLISESNNIFPDEVKDYNSLFEGQKQKVYVNAFERNPKARKQCIEHYGATCSICEFDFENTFGDIGKGFIHVHHLIPLSNLNRKYEVDPIQDLLPVCPNCHAMLHTENPPLKPEELKEIVHNKRLKRTRTGIDS